MIELGRRSLITGLVALVAAPAIMKVASLMPVNAALQPGNNLLTLQQITREAVRLFKNSNKFIRNYKPGEEAQLDVLFGPVYVRSGWSEFAADGAKVGSQLRIRLPNDYVVSDGPMLSDDQLRRAFWPLRDHEIGIEPVPVALGPLTLAAAAVTLAPAVLEKPVTRRFWGK